MYLVLLEFAGNKSNAGQHMAAHNAWIERGVGAGRFLLVGSLSAGTGGFLLANGLSRAELDTALTQDPFVEHGIVTARVVELSPKKADPRLAFLLT